MPEAMLLLSVGGGLIARQLRNYLSGPPEPCIMPTLSTGRFELDDEWLHPLLLGQPPVAVQPKPTLRLPASPANLAAWAAGALLSQALVLLVWRLADLWRGGMVLRARHISGRIEIESEWRAGHGDGYLVRGSRARHLSHPILHSPPT